MVQVLTARCPSVRSTGPAMTRLGDAVPAVWAAWGQHHASRDRMIAAASLGVASFLVMTVLVAVTSRSP